MEWGDKIPTLLRAQKQFGKTPQALLDMPDLPPYYEELVSHFRVLSNSRSYFSELIPTKAGGMMGIRRPNPIDISTILRYNQDIYGLLPPEDFLEIIQMLDLMYLNRAYSQKG